jgi:hypothetical protein
MRRDQMAAANAGALGFLALCGQVWYSSGRRSAESRDFVGPEAKFNSPV